MDCKIRIMGRKGSQSCSEIVKGTGIKRYEGKKYETDAIINYGLCGKKLRDFYVKYPSAKNIPTLNKHVGYSKYRALQLVGKKDILIPESRLELLKTHKIDDWIEKRFHSQGGFGICKARKKSKLGSKYYQKYIKNRKYELRVHGFMWIDPSKWKVQKRFGKEDEIAWNHRNGGYFISVNNPTGYTVFTSAIEITKTVLTTLSMVFGAADFIVSGDGKLYFIEINSCPGFQELSKNIYLDAFNSLKKLRLKSALKLTN